MQQVEPKVEGQFTLTAGIALSSELCLAGLPVRYPREKLAEAPPSTKQGGEVTRDL